MNWQELWNFRGIKYKGESPIIIDGWDSGSSKLEQKDLVKIVEKIRSKLNLEDEDKLLEVGCGAGMILCELSRYCKNIFGIDYAESLINIIKGKIPHGKFRVSEAKSIPFDEKFDKIYSFSVFQYFQDYHYATSVLETMLSHLKPHGKILICDIPDFNKKEKSEGFRERKPHKEDVKNSELTHLYYKKSFFQDFAKTGGLECEVFDFPLENYESSNFRFYALIY